MAKYRYGLKQMIISDIDPATGLPINPIDVTANVYKKTLEVTEADGNLTKHFAEGFTVPSVVLRESGEEVGKVSLFGITLDTLAALKGGTTTTVDGKSTYAKPQQEVNIEKHITFVTKDNVEMIYKRAFTDAVRDEKLNDSDVAMLKLTMVPMLPSDASEPVTIEEL